MPCGKKLSDLERGQIIAFNQVGMSLREIAKNIGRSHRVVFNLLKVKLFEIFWTKFWNFFNRILKVMQRLNVKEGDQSLISEQNEEFWRKSVTQLRVTVESEPKLPLKFQIQLFIGQLKNPHILLINACESFRR